SVLVQTLPIRPAIDPETFAMKLVAPKNATAAPPDYLARADKNFWLKKLEPSGLYVQINQCVNDGERTLDRLAEELGQAIRADKPRNLVVDVRLNNGGDYSKMLGVLKVLFAFETSRPDARLFVLMGRNTLSAAENVISTIDQFGGATFVGEPSGSKPNHVGD